MRRLSPLRANIASDGTYDVDNLDVDNLELEDPFGIVGDVMTTGALRCATPDQPLTAAASKLDKVTGLAVVDDNNVVVGVVSIKVRRMQSRGLKPRLARCSYERNCWRDGPLVFTCGRCRGPPPRAPTRLQDINRLRKQGTSLAEPVRKHMSSPPIVVREKARIGEAAALMLSRNIHRLPVVDAEGKLIG
jgi:CBS domain-containing protein